MRLRGDLGEIGSAPVAIALVRLPVVLVIAMPATATEVLAMAPVVPAAAAHHDDRLLVMEAAGVDDLRITDCP